MESIVYSSLSETRLIAHVQIPVFQDAYLMINKIRPVNQSVTARAEAFS